jgi:glyceraldehyde 3-phosphate dehydrogenase
MKSIGFIAESVRIPTSTGSLIVLVLNFQDELENPIKRTLLNSIYEEYAKTSPYLMFSKEQNVSSDIIGLPKAAVVIESTEIHTRTATIRVNLQNLKNFKFAEDSSPILDVPLTQTVIYGWYDNELGSYTNMLGELTISVAEKMV